MKETSRTRVLAYFSGSVVMTYVLFMIAKSIKHPALPHDLFVGSILTILLPLTTWKLTDAQKDAPIKVLSLWAIVCCFFILYIFRTTAFGLNGVYGDASLHTSLVNSIFYTWTWADPSYAHLATYYPPLYHTFLAGLAKISGAPPYAIIKYGLPVTMFISYYLGYSMWSRLLSAPAAVAIAILYHVTCNQFYKPFEMISLFVFVPWILLTFRDFSFASPWRVLLAGAAGALIFLTYYYWFFIGILWILLLVRLGWKEKNARPATVLSKPLLIGGIVFLATSGFWGPLVLDMYFHSPNESLNNRWFIREHLSLEEYIVFSPKILLLLVGALGLSVYRTFEQRLLSLGLLASIGWMLIGNVAMLAGMPLLHMRAIHLIEYILIVSAVYCITLQLQASAYPRAYVRCGIGIASFYAAVVFFSQFDNDLYKIAIETKPDSALIEIQKTHNLKDAVVLSNVDHMNAFLVAKTFINHNAHFSHPSSRFRDRLRMLIALSKVERPEFIRYLLRHNHFDPVDYIQTARDGTFRFLEDNYPNYPPQLEILLKFPPALIEGLSVTSANAHFYQLPQNPGAIEDLSSIERSLLAAYGDTPIAPSPEDWNTINHILTEMDPRLKIYDSNGRIQK